MAYSIDPIQDNCYPGTTVLVNKLHIHDEAALQEAEALATYVNASKLEQCPLEGVFDFAHYKACLTQLIRSAGYDLNWSEVDGDLLMIATIQAAQGVTDLLRQVLGEAIK